MRSREETIKLGRRIYDLERRRLAKRFGVGSRVIVVSSTVQKHPLFKDDSTDA